MYVYIQAFKWVPFWGGVGDIIFWADDLRFGSLGQLQGMI